MTTLALLLALVATQAPIDPDDPPPLLEPAPPAEPAPVVEEPVPVVEPEEAAPAPAPATAAPAPALPPAKPPAPDTRHLDEGTTSLLQLGAGAAVAIAVPTVAIGGVALIGTLLSSAFANSPGLQGAESVLSLVALVAVPLTGFLIGYIEVWIGDTFGPKRGAALLPTLCAAGVCSLTTLVATVGLVAAAFFAIAAACGGGGTATLAGILLVGTGVVALVGAGAAVVAPWMLHNGSAVPKEPGDDGSAPPGWTAPFRLPKTQAAMKF